MNPFLIFIIATGVAVFLLIALIKPKKKVKRTLIFDYYSEHGKIWVKQLFDLYTAGLTWETPPNPKYELYEKQFGVTLSLNEYGNKYNAYMDDIGIPKDYLDAPDDSLNYKLGNFFFELEMYLDIRYQYQYEPLRGSDRDSVLQDQGINIGQGETSYFSLSNVDWYEQHTISSTISYSGFKYRSGEAMSFNTGSFNVIRDNVTGFTLLDRGKLLLTDQRIIFVGNQSLENRSIPLRDILEYEIFKDGVLLGKSNGKKPLIFFPPAINTLIQPDGLNPFIRVLYRLLTQTQNENLS
jgi:hypothetical protein